MGWEVCGVPPLLAMVGSPLQWGVLALIVVVIFAPKLLPPLGRFAGYRLGDWLRASLRMPPARARPRRTPVAELPKVEVLPPPRTVHTLRAGARQSLSERPARRATAPVWAVSAVVTTAVAVLLWVLLHHR